MLTVIVFHRERAVGVCLCMYMFFVTFLRVDFHVDVIQVQHTHIHTLASCPYQWVVSPSFSVFMLSVNSLSLLKLSL